LLCGCMTQQVGAAAVCDCYLARRNLCEARPDPLRELAHLPGGANLAKVAIVLAKVDPGRGPHQQGAIATREEILDCAPVQAQFRAKLLCVVSIVAVKAVLGSHPQIAGNVLGNTIHIQVVDAFACFGETVVLRLASTHY